MCGGPLQGELYWSSFPLRTFSCLLYAIFLCRLLKYLFNQASHFIRLKLQTLADSGWELKCQFSIISLHSLHSWFICYPEIWVEFTYTFWSYLSLALSFLGTLNSSMSGNLGFLDSYPWYCKPESVKSVDWAESPKSQTYLMLFAFSLCHVPSKVCLFCPLSWALYV